LIPGYFLDPVVRASRRIGRTRIINFRSYLVVALTVLDVEAFERLLGPCMEVMKRNIEDYEDQLVKIFGSKNNISDIR
jgi:hypothetical protein